MKTQWDDVYARVAPEYDIGDDIGLVRFEIIKDNRLWWQDVLERDLKGVPELYGFILDQMIGLIERDGHG